MAHYAVPKVDVAKHDNFKEHNTTPSLSSRTAPGYNMTHDKNVYANETSKNHSGADMYETIEMNRAVVPQSKNSNEAKSQGIIDKILNKITKHSKQKPSYETTEAETEDGKTKQRSKTKGQSSTTKEDSTKETINSSQKTEGSQSAIFQGKQESTAADEDHYDKLAIDDNVVPKHPNYDKVSVPKRSLTLKMFKK